MLHVRGHEGRGVGLLHELRVYQFQNDGAGAVDVNLALGVPTDARDYGARALILSRLRARGFATEALDAGPAAGLISTGPIQQLLAQLLPILHLTILISVLSHRHGPFPGLGQ